MPFSATKSCTEEEWTEFFEQVLKPAVEGDPDLGYACRRSNPTRGNFVRGILEELQTAHVVIADLTDRNPNVFYELGIRHTLADRTILLAQSRNDIPSDLQSYANHVYTWRTAEQKAELTQKIRDLLRDVDYRPDRPDNPVSDFLGATMRPESAASTPGNRVAILEQQVLSLATQVATLSGGSVSSAKEDLLALDWAAGHSLLDAIPEGLSLVRVVRALQSSRNDVLVKGLIRRTGRAVRTMVAQALARVPNSGTGGVTRQDIPALAQPYIDAALPVVDPILSFALACVSERFDDGVRGCIQVAGDLISLSQSGGGGSRFVAGAPGFIAWRLLLAMGALAVDHEDYRVAGLVINEPIEVQLVGGQLTYEPLWSRGELFFPESHLGYADIGMRALVESWGRGTALRAAFSSEGDYRKSLIQFLAMIAIRHADHVKDPHDQFYPGYRLVEGVRASLRQLGDKLRGQPEFKTAIASILGETVTAFAEAWARRAAVLNQAKLGNDYSPGYGPDFPPSLDPGANW